jgi:ABC-type transporter lipoprotein component MlaA
MTHKNPFEIRAEMVQLAKDYMDHQYHMNVQLANDLFEQGKLQLEQVQEAYTMYSIEEMMEKAKEMYSFVSTKDR